VGRQALRYNRHSGIHYAVTRATRSTGALLLSVRPPIQRELDMMQAKGVELEVTPIARDALVFGLSRENPVDGLTLEQIQAIYGGNVARWDEVGGPAERIRVYRQDNTSGPHGLMRELVMNRRFMVDARELRRGSLDTLLDDTWGIGYSVFYQMDSMTPHAGIKLAEINGVAPTMATIRSGEYPLCSEILAIIRVDEPAESIVRRTLDWLLTDDGQKVVADAGYIPLDPGVAGQ
jgi:phosphate transport system substrate-binding protein